MPSRPTRRAKAIRAGRQEFAPPGMSWDDTLGNMRVLDKWRADVGLGYGIERPEAPARTLREHAARPRGRPMPQRRDPRARASPTSVLALGLRGVPRLRQRPILLDAFFERGGNLFDTAWIYGAGRTETILGEWLRAAACARRSVIIGKGAHSPLTYPDVIGRQLTESLERLGTDHIDVYFMHRDNPDVPVGEFVDAMDAEVRGRAHPRAVRRLELDARTLRRGDRLCRGAPEGARRRCSPTTSRSPR